MQEYQTNFNTAVRCRSSGACRGFLDSVVRQDLAAVMPTDGAQRCRGRLFAAVTQARPGNATDVSLLLGPQWGANAEVINAAAVSSFLPSSSNIRSILPLPGHTRPRRLGGRQGTVKAES